MILPYNIYCYNDNVVIVTLAFSCALQVVAIDFQAITLAGVACLLPPLKQLNRHKAVPVSSVSTFILLSFMAMLAAAVQVVDMLIVIDSPWFPGGTGTSDSVSTSLALQVVAQLWNISSWCPFTATDNISVLLVSLCLIA